MSPADLLAPGSLWFPRYGADPVPDAALRLVCFPYAGGTASVYRDWQPHLGGRTEVTAVQLPGRGLRLREAPYTRAAPLVADLTAALLTEGLLNRPYAFFGHSMGALLAHEVAHALRERGEPGPLHLFASGSRAPHLYGERADHLLSDAALRGFADGLGGLGHTGANPAGGAYFERRLPVLRADLTVCGTYRWRPRRPLTCPMTAFSAAGDPIAGPEDVEAWRPHTTGSFLRHHLPGGHFYLNGPARKPLLRELHTELDRLAAASAAT
ncbi:thioesterase II family protein [Streptomyces gamaensis]|uniref:Thioesterase II family protein n=1 Tax=Streptomyces gamaensis TaxID=1763542 RepID=A0ABW0YX35_9ACTN